MSLLPAATWEAVPDDCWFIIFGLIDDHESLSLVNKRFLAITNLARATHTIRYPLLAPLRYTRFPNLQYLVLNRPHPDLDGFLQQLAGSNLPLRSLTLFRQVRFPRNLMRLLGRSSLSKTLRALSYACSNHMDNEDVLAVADSFSYLHRLELDQPINPLGVMGITDSGLLAISIKLKSLVSFFFIGNEDVTDRSMQYLSSNCPLLSHLKITYSYNSVESFCSFALLSSLELTHVRVSQSGLLQLSGANLKIRKLYLSNPFPRELPGDAFCIFLSSCRLLNHLVLKYAEVSNDATALDFVASIPNVNYLHITNVDLITPTILFNLLEGCPNLEDIALKRNLVQIVKYSSQNLPNHPRMRKLFLSGWELSNDIFDLVASICPNLEFFSVDGISLIVERGSCCSMNL